MNGIVLAFTVFDVKSTDVLGCFIIYAIKMRTVLDFILLQYIWFSFECMYFVLLK